MQIVPRCKRCYRELIVATTYYDGALDELVVEVIRCGCGDIDCSECEDIEAYKLKIREQKEVIDGQARKLAQHEAIG